MKKNIKRALMIITVTILTCVNGVFASSVPQKTETTGTESKYQSDTQKVVETVNENKSESTQSSDKEDNADSSSQSEATPKATQKATQKSTQKATQKATQTPKATQKSTQKTTEKATQKATQKATEKAQSTISTIEPEETEGFNDVEETEENVIVVEDEERKPEINVVTNPEQINANKYLTKGGAFGMFILTVLVSAVVSFLISYRFYKMNRTDGHLAAEIRALKRDFDTKMAGTVGGFSEYETKTINRNRSYAKEGQPIRRYTEEKEEQTQGADIYAKWERQISTKNVPEDREGMSERRSERRTTTTRNTRSRKQKSAADKIKDAFYDIFSKKN